MSPVGAVAGSRRGPHAPKVTAVTGWLRWSAVLAATVSVLAGCGSSAAPSKPATAAVPTASAVPLPAGSSGPDQLHILTLYRRYWTEVLPAAAAAPAGERRAILDKIMVEPGTSALLALLLRLDRAGRRFYGQATLITQVVEQQGATALVRGCINSYGLAQQETATGKFISRGVPREAVLMTFQRTSDGGWRVYGTYFPKDPRC